MPRLSGTPFDRVFLKEFYSNNNLTKENCEGKKIKILGIITGKKRFKSVTKLKSKGIFQVSNSSSLVDDGTDILNCVVFPIGISDFLSEDQLEGCQEIYLTSEITRLYGKGNFNSCLEASINNHTEVFNYGDCVEIYGVSKLYRGEIEMTVHFYKIIKDPNVETQSILETLVNKNHL